MMMHAYDKVFLEDAMENLGSATEYMVCCKKVQGQEFFDLFLVSGVAESFSVGEVRYLSGMSGIELAKTVADRCHFEIDYGTYELRVDYSPEYWAGWALAYFQWYSARSFAQIFRKIQFDTLMNLYEPLHQADLSKVVEIFETFFSKEKQTNLARMRAESGLSQSELAEKSGLSLRSIQMYEQRHNNINKAQVNRLIAMVKALNCRMEDILE